VHLAPWGSFVVIPTGLAGATTRVERWIDGPQPNRALPEACSVVALTRRLTYGRPLGLSA
jgi:hypothetical protein